MKDVIIVRKTMPIFEKNKIERTEADLQKAEADLAYVAMMTDVEIPTEDEVIHNDIREN